MKKILLILGIFALVSCVGMQSATSYYYTPKTTEDLNLGKITYIVEKQGYSIISVEKPNTLIYVCGRLDGVEKPYVSLAYIMKQGKVISFVYENKRYLVDDEKSTIYWK